jgi:hypothetical protein
MTKPHLEGELTDRPKEKPSLLRKAFLFICRCIPIGWLADALKSRGESYIIVVMNQEKWGEEKDNNGIGYYEGEGFMTFSCTPEFCRIMFDELDKKIEVELLMKSAGKL